MDIAKSIETLLGDYVTAWAILVVGAGVLVWKVATSIKGLRVKVDRMEGLPCATCTCNIVGVR